jgi:ABC-type Fe3+/spermidine/putrescine transport system ATPase subunit
MSDRIAVLAEGRVRQIGTPKEVYLASSSAGVARVVGSVNVMTGKLDASADGFARMTTDSGTPIRCRMSGESIGDKVEVMVRPELITVLSESASANGMNGANVLKGKVIRVLFAGDHIDCYCDTPDGMIRAKLPPDNELGVDDNVHLYFKPEHCVAS